MLLEQLLLRTGDSTGHEQKQKKGGGSAKWSDVVRMQSALPSPRLAQGDCFVDFEVLHPGQSSPRRGGCTTGRGSSGSCVLLLLLLLLLLPTLGTLGFFLFQVRQDMIRLNKTIPFEIREQVRREMSELQVGPFQKLRADGSRQESNKPSAHFTAPIRKTELPASPSKLDWDSSLGNSFMRNGVAYHHGDVTVPKEGLYFIYSQVFFRSPQCNRSPLYGVDHGDSIMVHSVYRHSRTYDHPDALMEGMKFQCSDDNNRSRIIWYGSNYQAGLFYLQAGDQLWVRVSDGSLIVARGEKTYFGLFMV